MDINKLMQQAQAMQKEMEKAAAEINEMEFEGVASNGLVKVVINGENKVQSVSLDRSILNPEDKEMIEDLIMIAVNDAVAKVDEKRENSFGSMASAMGIR